MEFTSLPNLHPAFVHFPIALVPLALLFDLVGLFWRKAEWLDRAAASVWVLAGVAAFVTYQTGESAADGLSGVPASVEPLIGTHSDWGHWTFYGLAAFALLRLGATIWDPKRERRIARWLLVLPAAALFGVVAYTAELGGQLVYGHGVAVQKTEAEALPEAGSANGETAEQGGDESGDESGDENAGSPASRLVTTEGGTVVWRPAASDAAALGSVVTPLGDTTFDALTAQDATSDGGSDGGGLTLEASGESWIALPGTFGDVRVEAELDLAGFEGEVGLFHHAQGPEAAGLLVQSTDGVQKLVQIRDGSEELGAEEHAPPGGTFVLALSAAGAHYKGLMDGATVTHGHAEPGPEGRTGLLLRGEGKVRLLRLSAQPL